MGRFGPHLAVRHWCGCILTLLPGPPRSRTLTEISRLLAEAPNRRACVLVLGLCERPTGFQRPFRRLVSGRKIPVFPATETARSTDWFECGATAGKGRRIWCCSDHSGGQVGDVEPIAQQVGFTFDVIHRELSILCSNACPELPRRVPRGEASRKAGCRKSARPV